MSSHWPYQKISNYFPLAKWLCRTRFAVMACPATDRPSVDCYVMRSRKDISSAINAAARASIFLRRAGLKPFMMSRTLVAIASSFSFSGARDERQSACRPCGSVHRRSVFRSRLIYPRRQAGLRAGGYIKCEDHASDAIGSVKAQFLHVCVVQPLESMQNRGRQSSGSTQFVAY